MSQIIQFNNDSWIAYISGTIASFIFMAIDGFTIPCLFNIGVVDFILKASQTAILAAIGGMAGIIGKELYSYISKPVKSWFKNKFTDKTKMK